MKTPVQICPVSIGVSSSSRGTSLTSGSSQGTYSSSFGVLSSDIGDLPSFGFLLNARGSTSTRQTIRIYVGGSGSEVEIATLVGPSSSVMSTVYFVPIFIPANSRVTAKSAAFDTSATVYVHLTLIRGRSYDPLVSYGRVSTITSSDFPDVDAGASANTKGSYTELVNSTTRDAKGYTLFLLSDPSNDTDENYLFDLAVGGSGSEVIILADIQANAEAFRGDCRPHAIGPVWTPIPAGSRLAVRCQSSSTSANSRKPKVALVMWE